MMKALIVGGTGPSGPFLANGLIERGYQVTIFHRGTHEIPEIVPEVAHIHGDPHFRETIEAALGDRAFDVVIATYGRTRFVAEALAGKWLQMNPPSRVRREDEAAAVKAWRRCRAQWAAYLVANDFLIGAHAWNAADRLLNRDLGFDESISPGSRYRTRKTFRGHSEPYGRTRDGLVYGDGLSAVSDISEN
jgi:predicted nucleic acid-binding protein